MKTIVISLYSFDELCEEIQNKIVIKEIQSITERITKDLFLYALFHNDIIRSENMSSPWALNEILYFERREGIKEFIKIKKHLYTETGDIYIISKGCYKIGNN